MSAHVLLNLLNELEEKIRCKALLSILLIFSIKFNTIIQELECKILFYCGTLKSHWKCDIL